jgi:hypothetical protein
MKRVTTVNRTTVNRCCVLFAAGALLTLGACVDEGPDAPPLLGAPGAVQGGGSGGASAGAGGAAAGTGGVNAGGAGGAVGGAAGTLGLGGIPGLGGTPGLDAGTDAG